MPISPDMMGGMGGPPGMGGPGMGGPGMMTPGLEGDPAMGMGLSALDSLSPKSPNPTEALNKVDQALQLAHQLVLTALPQIQAWNPKVAKDLHAIGKQILSAKMDLKKEQGPMGPPPTLGMEGAGGAMGMPMGGSLPTIGSPA